MHIFIYIYSVALIFEILGESLCIFVFLWTTEVACSTRLVTMFAVLQYYTNEQFGAACSPPCSRRERGRCPFLILTIVKITLLIVIFKSLRGSILWYISTPLICGNYFVKMYFAKNLSPAVDRRPGKERTATTAFWAPSPQSTVRSQSMR